MSDAPKPDDTLVTVLVTSDEARMMVARSLLAAEGIPCVVEGEGSPAAAEERLGSANPLPVGEARIQVRPEDADAARALLAATDEGFEPERDFAGH
jgi:hypothetical protein